MKFLFSMLSASFLGISSLNLAIPVIKDKEINNRDTFLLNMNLNGTYDVASQIKSNVARLMVSGITENTSIKNHQGEAIGTLTDRGSQKFDLITVSIYLETGKRAVLILNPEDLELQGFIQLDSNDTQFKYVYFSNAKIKNIGTTYVENLYYTNYYSDLIGDAEFIVTRDSMAHAFNSIANYSGNPLIMKKHLVAAMLVTTESFRFFKMADRVGQIWNYEAGYDWQIQKKLYLNNWGKWSDEFHESNFENAKENLSVLKKISPN
ncbi:ribosome-inactivating family protein [Spiroplasma sabaudiense]|nr:ribosome-inactivating family protein [Spiroplasma sabaudiense]